MREPVEEGNDEMLMPVIGPAVPGAIRVNFCPSCGASRRDATWSFEEFLRMAAISEAGLAEVTNAYGAYYVHWLDHVQS